jgi:hypothetical protein
LVVVREGHTRRKILNKALESIERKKLIGCVFNEAASTQATYEQFGGYGYYAKKSGSHSGGGNEGKAATA